jgi:sterol desaturase/sphingolipid hydroxylase (fatty acid hydroxylase superfamily)
MLVTAVRYGAYPLVMGAMAMAATLVLFGVLPAWLTLLIAAAAAIGAVALLERLQPFERAWQRDHGDTRADRLHGLVNFALLAGAAYALHALRTVIPAGVAWPTTWPAWIQCLLAGAIVDLGLYAMHRVSHRFAWAWRLHAIHHSAERLYWLNGERRHPLSALLMAGPGLIVVVALGAPALVVSVWLALLSVHLAFQHANLDYSVGPLRRWLGTAELHRWHHKREYEDAQVNFGEFWLVWDRLFGTFLDRPGHVGAGDVGLREATVPAAYGAQLRWPFQVEAIPDLPRDAPFQAALAQGYAALDAGDAAVAYAAFERAHVLGQPRTRTHVRSHVAFLRWAIRQRDAREIVGQLLRIAAAALFTWLWMPRGNTGGARVSAFRPMPVPTEISNLMKGNPR